ncbi:hypothetical protein I302_101747 [Kwoniella bestiolae CBS 10118]|uniref:Uncharacterized protein n=1 Tax=Kwoniella bestiolae CBS 10118 TaxID=1296100 RepID=A0A1B9GD41_9TREE|nr:hypothetical protein I302_00424 [Kwoniella bestiolae CBS 10118]OCF28934.1 hypothetical protein I302_00424 [Kwoniella bestiolae CBS 10118]
MPRPGQAQARRKRALEEMEAGSSTSYTSYNYSNGPSNLNCENDYNLEADDDGDDEEGGAIDNPRSQCLPVGMLPEDFDGTPLDGSQYLAMANRDNRDLPFVKTVINPYKTDLIGPTLPSTSQNHASGSRHPALPKESWQELFPIHYQGYRKHIQSQLSSSPSTSTYPSDYPPIPPASRRSDWYAYINGYIPPDKSKNKDKKGKGKAKPIMSEEEMMNASMGQEMDIDTEKVEEEVVEDVIVGKTSRGNEKVVGAPREPLLGVLRNLNSSQALNILSHFAHWLSESIEQSPPPIPTSPYLPPTQPGDHPPPHQHKTINHLSSNYFSWIFSLLLITDQHLSSDEISTLRDLARASMKVAGHRYILGVVGKQIGEGWKLGDELKAKHVEDGDQGLSSGKEDNSVDQILARCWLIVHAVASGWGQKDLLYELDNLFT